MLARIDWSNLTVAVAFVLGALVGAVATVRLVRYLADYFRGGARSDRHGDDDA